MAEQIRYNKPVPFFVQILAKEIIVLSDNQRPNRPGRSVDRDAYKRPALQKTAGMEPTRIMPPVNEGEGYRGPAQPRYATRRVAPVDDRQTEAPAQAVESETAQPRVRRRRTERFAYMNEAPLQAENAAAEEPVETPKAKPEQAAPVQPMTVQAVPRPRQNADDFLRANQGQRDAAARQGAYGQPRRPVNAPGYSQARPVRGRDEEVQPPRPARRPRPEDSYYEEEDSFDMEHRGHGCLTAALVIVMIIALLIVGLMVWPKGNDGFIGTVNGVKDQVITWVGNVKNMILPEAKTPAAALDFKVLSATGQAPQELVFSLTTTKTATGVSIVDQATSETLSSTVSVATDNEDARIWSLSMMMETEFNGLIEAYVQDEGAWVPTGKTVQISLTAPVITPSPEPVPPTVIPPEVQDGGEDTWGDMDWAEDLAADTPEVSIPSAEPSIEPTTEPTEVPTEAPVITQAPAPVTQAPTQAPTPEPTEVPTPELTQAPTPEPTPEPTQAPTPEPTATPMPYLDAAAVKSTDPDRVGLMSNAYIGSKKQKNFSREVPIQFSAPEGYSYWAGGVLTFRGDSFRQNAAFGTVNVQDEKLAVAWSVPVGSLDSYHGIGWTGQPAIVKWSKEVREMMNLTEEKKAVKALKEVIIASQDGNIYFLDLADGQETRDPISVGYPMTSGVSIDPRGYPLMSVGQGVRKLKSGTGSIGTYLFNLIDQSQLAMINGRDDRAKWSNGAFDGTSLFDKNSDSLIVAGENGMLYTLKLNAKFSLEGQSMTIEPSTVAYVYRSSREKNNQVGIEGSVAMYGQYAYFADTYGILQCVDVNTMKPVWAVNVGDNTDATIALDFDENGDLGLYTANTVNRQGKKGVCTVRRLNALTGEEVWAVKIDCAYDADELGGAMASPVVGQHSISNLVIFTLAKTEEGGAVIAFDKMTGSIVWQKNMNNFSWSSPVAVYNENGDAWIIQGDSQGVLQLLDGQSGTVLHSLQLEGAIHASPAVYNDMLVVGTSGKDVSKIYGIQIQ